MVKLKNQDFFELNVFTNGKKENSIKFPKNCLIKLTAKTKFKDVQDKELYVLDSKVSNELGFKL